MLPWIAVPPGSSRVTKILGKRVRDLRRLDARRVGLVGLIPVGGAARLSRLSVALTGRGKSMSAAE